MEIEQLVKALQTRKGKVLLLVFGLFGIRPVLYIGRIYLYFSRPKIKHGGK